jgi:hypothetical protein
MTVDLIKRVMRFQPNNKRPYTANCRRKRGEIQTKKTRIMKSV